MRAECSWTATRAFGVILVALVAFQERVEAPEPLGVGQQPHSQTDDPTAGC
jgi:hypothetical protein